MICPVTQLPCAQGCGDWQLPLCNIAGTVLLIITFIALALALIWFLHQLQT